MKKRILLLIIIILFTTGCTCEYNLDIVNDSYKETITLTADNQEELKQFNINWKIPTDKEEYDIGEKVGSTPTYESDLYDYNLSNNILTFTHTFSEDGIINSTAVFNCYDLLNIEEYDSALIISTSSKLRCFDSYPEINTINVTITVDKEVISHNADYVNGNKYTWYLKKSEKDKNPINMTINNKINEKTKTETDNNNSKNNNNNNKITNKPDYTLYIFCAILLIVMLLAYYLYNKLKSKNNEMDD